MRPVAVRSKLSGKLHGQYPVFHVLFLYRYLPGGDVVEPPAPVIVEDVDEYQVEAFVEY